MSRKTRSDAGQLIFTERDRFALQWITEQYAIRLDQLQLLLTQLSVVEPINGELLGYPTVMTKLRKWIKAGYVEYERILASGPGWIFMRRAGIKVAGLDYPARKPDWCRLKHIYAVNQVRLLVDHDYWRDERQIKMDRERGSEQIIPDAEMWLEGDAENDPIAVEVQLSPLMAERFQEKMAKLTDFFAYRRVRFYVPSERLAAAARRARESLSFADQGKIEIEILPLTL